MKLSSSADLVYKDTLVIKWKQGFDINMSRGKQLLSITFLLAALLTFFTVPIAKSTKTRCDFTKTCLVNAMRLKDDDVMSFHAPIKYLF